MEKTKMKVSELCELKDDLMKWTRDHKDATNPQTMGQIVDMIKDLAEAEEKCWKACYYKTVIEAMHEEEEEIRRAGYDHWRYSSGRYAPKGRGHYSAGFTPTFDEMGVGEMDWDFQNPRMGYTRSGDSRSHMPQRGYERYKNARMGYHESGSSEDRMAMNEAAKEHMEEVSESMRDIWKDADPSLKKELKSHLTSLIGEMN